MFDRRYEIYDTTRNALGHIVREAVPLPPPLEFEFIQAMNLARLLFAGQVHSDLQEIWGQATDFHVLKANMDALFRKEQHYGEGNPERERVLLNWFHDRLTTLPDLFGDDLRLSS